MSENQIESFRLQKRSVSNFLLAKKCKPCLNLQNNVIYTEKNVQVKKMFTDEQNMCIEILKSLPYWFFDVEKHANWICLALRWMWAMGQTWVGIPHCFSMLFWRKCSKSQSLSQLIFCSVGGKDLGGARVQINSLGCDWLMVYGWMCFSINTSCNLVLLQELYWVTTCFIFVCQMDASWDP